jgi:hypothetical protein
VTPNLHVFAPSCFGNLEAGRAEHGDNAQITRDIT